MVVANSVVSPDLVAAGLQAADAEERRQATSSIAELYLPDALPLLVQALGDADWRVRKEATCAARAFVPAPRLVEAMIAIFGSSDNVGSRNAAVDVLGSCGSAATEPLSRAFAGLDADGRKLVVQALGSTRDPHAISALARALDDKDSNVCQGAVEAIARLGPLCPAEVEKLLLHSLEGDDPFCQLAALEGLNALGAVVPWDKLEPLFVHSALRVAALTAAALAEDPRAPSTIVRLMPAARGNTFLHAMAALARMADGPLLPEVYKALETDGAELGSRFVQLASSAAVEASHDRAHALLLAAMAAAPGIVDAAAHALEDDLLGEAADRALRLLGPKVLPDLIARIAPSEGAEVFSPDVRAALIEAAAAIAHTSCPPEILTKLIAALRNAAAENDRRLTTSALCALSRVGDEHDLEVIARFVGSTAKSTAHAAEAALALLTRRHPAAARRVADALIARAARGSTDDACTAIILVGALADLPSASRQTFSLEDMTFLTRCATAPEPRMRRSAVEALAAIGGGPALRVMSLALTDDVREVQLAAARALGVMGRAASFRDAHDVNTDFPSLRTAIDIVMRSMDAELVATTVRSIGEDFEVVAEDPTSMHAARAILAELEPLAREAEATIAIASVESIGRLPRGMAGRETALALALSHPDDAVVKSAMLKLDTTGLAGSKILQCLDHPSFDVRSLAAEIMAGSDNPMLRLRLAERTSHELDLNMRDTLEGALSSIRWRGERSVSGS